MDDQLNGDVVSLESLISSGRVTHLCALDRQAVSDETAALMALCEAVAGQIYRIGELTYVFHMEASDLDGALDATPREAWGDLLDQRLRAALSLGDDPEAVRIREVESAVSMGGEQDEDADADAMDTAVAAQDLEAPDPEPDFEFAGPPAPSAEQVAAATALALSAAEETVEPETAAEIGPEPVEARDSAHDDEPDLRETAMVEEAAAAALDEADAGATQIEPKDAPAGAGVDQRLTEIEAGLGRMQAMLAGLADGVAAQSRAVASAERVIDDLAAECRRLPERAARHMAARSDGLVPISMALTNVLRRLDQGSDGPDLAPVQNGLAEVQAQLRSLTERVEAEPQVPALLARRLDDLSAAFETLPERAAVQAAARANALAPVHVALSGALFRLEHRIESLMQTRPGTPAEADGELRHQMAEFLSRLEQRVSSETAES